MEFNLKPKYDLAIYQSYNRKGLFRLEINGWRNWGVWSEFAQLADCDYLLSHHKKEYVFYVNPVFEVDEILVALNSVFRIKWLSDYSISYMGEIRELINEEFDDNEPNEFTDSMWSNSSVSSDVVIKSVQAGVKVFSKSSLEKALDDIEFGINLGNNDNEELED